MPSYYQVINRQKYDRGMLDAAREGQDERGVIHITAAREIVEQALDHGEYTEIEHKTTAYILKQFKFTSPGKKYIQNTLAQFDETHPKKTAKGKTTIKKRPRQTTSTQTKSTQTKSTPSKKKRAQVENESEGKDETEKEKMFEKEPDEDQEQETKTLKDGKEEPEAKSTEQKKTWEVQKEDEPADDIPDTDLDFDFDSSPAEKEIEHDLSAFDIEPVELHDRMTLREVFELLKSTISESHHGGSVITVCDEFDANNDRRLSEDEFGQCCNSLGFSLSPGMVHRIFRVFDLDGSGSIEYLDFIRTISYGEGRLEALLSANAPHALV